MVQRGRRIAIAVLFLVLARPGAAQWFPSRHFTVSHGLAQSQVTAIAQDHDGYVWFATWGGVSRFDGRGFTSFDVDDGLPDTLATAIAVGPDGAVYVGTDAGGLAVFRRGRLQVIPPPSADELAPVTGLAIHGTSLLVATEAGLWRMDGGRSERLLRGPVRNLVPAPGGAVMVVADRLYAYRGGPLQDLPAVDGVPLAAAVDGEGRWVATADGIHRRASDGTWRSVQAAVPEATCLLVGSSGELWVGTRSGLWQVEPTGRGASAVALTPHEPQSEIRALALDHEGSLWVGTWGEGVFQHVAGAFEIFSQETGLPSSTVWSMVEDDERCIWMATHDSGVHAWCDGAWRHALRTADGLPSDHTMSLQLEPDGTLWIGTRAGLARRTPDGRIRSFTARDGIPEYARVVVRSPGGHVWLGSNDGLARWDGTSWTRWTIADGLPDDIIRGLAFDRAGRLWVATHSGGVAMLADGRFTRFTTAQGLPHDRVWAIMVDSRDRVWAGTDAGIWIHPASGDAPDRVVAAGSGLLNLNVLSLLEDRDGAVWAGSTRGVAQVSPDGTVLRVFTAADGLSDSEGAENSVLLDHQGKVWLGMANGVTRIDPALLPHNPRAPQVVLERVLVNGAARDGPFPLATGPSPLAEPLRLGPEDSDLRFEFAALSFRSPENVLYRYQLIGYDPQPGVLTEDRHATYRRVPPGRYRFVVEACNEDGVFSTSPVAAEIRVLPPLWGTLGFRLAGALLVAGALVTVVRARATAQRRREHELEKVVARRTAQLEEANRRITQQNCQLEELSRTDPLTGLKNRRSLAEQLPLEMSLLQRELVRTAGQGDPLHGVALYLLDLDHFKTVNDLYGHEAGDQLLQAVGRNLQAALREVDLAVRWGGEELVVLARGLDAAGSLRLARKLMEVVAATTILVADDVTVSLTASVGFVPYPLGRFDSLRGHQWPQLVEAADRMMYLAKARGRSRACGVHWRNGSPPAASESSVLAHLLAEPAEPPAGIDLVELTLSAHPAATG